MSHERSAVTKNIVIANGAGLGHLSRNNSQPAQCGEFQIPMTADSRLPCVAVESACDQALTCGPSAAVDQGNLMLATASPIAASALDGVMRRLGFAKTTFFHWRAPSIKYSPAPHTPASTAQYKSFFAAFFSQKADEKVSVAVALDVAVLTPYIRSIKPIARSVQKFLCCFLFKESRMKQSP